MKIQYRDSGTQHTPIAASQVEVRDARPPRGKSSVALFVVFGLTVIIALAIWWYNGSRVHTYGVVATGMELFHAPVRSHLRAIHVEPGDRVEADQLLFVLSSEESEAKLDQVRSELDRQRMRLESLQSRQGQNPDPQRQRDVTRAREHCDLLRRNVAALEADEQRAVLMHAAELQRLDEQMGHLQTQVDRFKQQLSSAKRLLKHGAATRAEVTRLEGNVGTASFEQSVLSARKASLIDLRAAEQKRYRRNHQEAQRALRVAEAHCARLEQDYAEVATRRQQDHQQAIADVKSHIAGLQGHIEHLRQLAGPTEVRALADGVVMEIAVSVGSTVAKDGIIMSVAGTGKSWISAFVDAEDADEIAIGRSARIYPTAGGGPLAGRVTAGGGLEYKVHPSLRNRINSFSAVYTRIDLDNGGHGLIPGNVVEIVLED